MEINVQQIGGWLRIGLAAGGPLGAIVLSKTGLSAQEWALYLEAILYVVPPMASAIWTWMRNRKSVQIQTVNALPEVAKVVVKDDANGAVGALAECDNHPTIVTETQNVAEVVTKGV